jgi:hypothetical protein
MTLGQQSSPDITAPSTPSGLTATNITGTSFTLTWNAATDPVVGGAVTSGVKGYEIYGPSSCAVSGIVGYCGSVMHTGTTNTYSLPITGLTASTTYTGSAGTKAGFTVLAFDNTNNYSSASARLAVTTTSGGSTLCTDPTATNYGGSLPCVYPSIDVCPNIVGIQTTIPTGMVIDISGNCVPIVTTDTTPPVISSIATSGITQTGATITWTTDESATSVVEYGTSTSYGSTVSSSVLSVGHSTTLTGLTANTTYHYRVKSADAATNLSTSTDRVFTTTGTTASCPNAATLKDQRQMWVWKESIAMLTPGATQTNLFNYVDAKKVTMVYMSMHASEITSNATAIKTFLDTAWNNHCLQVQFLDGDASWVTPNFSAAVAWATAAKNLDLSITAPVKYDDFASSERTKS